MLVSFWSGGSVAVGWSGLVGSVVGFECRVSER